MGELPRWCRLPWLPCAISAISMKRKVKMTLFAPFLKKEEVNLKKVGLSLFFVGLFKECREKFRNFAAVILESTSTRGRSLLSTQKLLQRL